MTCENWSLASEFIISFTKVHKWEKLHGLWTSYYSAMKGQENMATVHKSNGNGFLNPISGLPSPAPLSGPYRLVENWAVLEWSVLVLCFCLSFISLNQALCMAVCCFWIRSCWSLPLCWLWVLAQKEGAMTLRTQLLQRTKVQNEKHYYFSKKVFFSASNELNTRKIWAFPTTTWMEVDYNSTSLWRQLLMMLTILVHKTFPHTLPVQSLSPSLDAGLASSGAPICVARTPTCLAWLTQRRYWLARAEQLRVCWAFWR